MSDDKTVVQIRAPLDSIAARVDNIRHLLLAAKSVGDVTAVKDQAKAIQRMTKGIRAARDSHNECGVLVIECTARVGEEPPSPSGVGAGTPTNSPYTFANLAGKNSPGLNC